MFQIKDFTPRIYQENILKTTLDYNTLVVLPTGMGKTAISILLSIERLNKYPFSKILICSPTKPLCQQHLESFKKYTNLSPNSIVLFTGSILPIKRQELIENSKILIATPQTIESDIKNNRLSLKNFSLLTIDEAHRSRQKFANTIITKIYKETSQFPKILALTASPGGTKEKINEIVKNLFIDKVEIRTEKDEDIQPYVQKRNFEWITVELPEELKQLHSLIKEVYKDKLKELKKLGYTKPISVINKRDLLELQKRFLQEIKNKNQIAFYGISLVAQLMKLSYCLELLETQTLNSLQQFFNKLQKEDTKAAKAILKLKNIQKAISLNNLLIEKNINHPKIEKLISIIKEELKKDPNSRIIIFANYRFTVSEIVKKLQDLNIKTERFVGQADKTDKGLKQKEQSEVLKKFKEGNFNVLVSSQVAEEGIDVVETKAVVFYEPIASELRRIQRIGRTARTQPGKIIFLITKGTRDEAYYWKSKRGETRMRMILQNMQNKSETQGTLNFK